MLVLIQKRFHKDTLAKRSGDNVRELLTFYDMRRAALWMHINRNTALPYTITWLRRAITNN